MPTPPKAALRLEGEHLASTEGVWNEVYILQVFINSLWLSYNGTYHFRKLAVNQRKLLFLIAVQFPLIAVHKKNLLRLSGCCYPIVDIIGLSPFFV